MSLQSDNSLNPSTEFKLTQALSNDEVVNFVTDAFIESYQRHFYPYTKEVVLMVETAITLLKTELTEKKKSHQSLFTILSYINENIFKINNRSFWFNKIYATYKKNIRPKIEYAQIKPHILGKKVLDFGSGIGSLALELKKRKYVMQTTDVLDYRIKEARNILFNKMDSPGVLNYQDNAVETVTVKSVLHHIDKQYLIPVVKELHRIAKRVIIEESIYFKTSYELAVEKAKSQPMFKRFLNFSPPDQYLALLLIDFTTNALAFGKPNMNLPFEFRAIEEWEKLFIKMGFIVNHIEVLGFESERVTPDSRVLIIIDRI